jgi:hypothetical protein
MRSCTREGLSKVFGLVNDATTKIKDDSGQDLQTDLLVQEVVNVGDKLSDGVSAFKSGKRLL